MSTGQVASPRLLSDVLMASKSRKRNLFSHDGLNTFKTCWTRFTPPTQAFRMIYRHCRSSQNLMTKPSFGEVEKGIISLKDNKTAGPDIIPAEIIKFGGCALHRRHHNFILVSSTAMEKYQHYSCIQAKWRSSRMWQKSWHLPSLCSRQSAG